MKKIDTIKLSKEMNDTLIHRSCVMRSGQYLSSYLIYENRSVDAIRLLGRCSVHDISKIQNTEEFMSLASIIDEIDEMHDVEHKLSKSQQEAIALHWKNNSHHPEYYESPNDMSDLDLLEMACDCHARSKQYGTNLIEYIEKQQIIRFNFDKDHYRKLKKYCLALVTLTKNDDYSSVLDINNNICFDLKDSTMALLESFDEGVYLETLKTDRLFLKKEHNHDFASVVYSINLKEDNSEIGYVSVKCNGVIEYKVFENYLGNGYSLEALEKIIEVTNMPELCISVKRDDAYVKTVVEMLGFKACEVKENLLVYIKKSQIKKLEKVPV